MNNQSVSLLGPYGGEIVGMVAFVFLGALLTQLGTKWVAGFKPKFGVACAAQLGVYVISFVIGGIVGRMVSMSVEDMGGGAMLLIILPTIFAQSALFSLMLKRPDGTGIGYGRACLIALIQPIVLNPAVRLVRLLFLGAV